MKYLVQLTLICLFIACDKPSQLELAYGCDAGIPENTVTKTDFKKNFKIDIPNHWKTSYFYTPNSSEMFAADTTKQLSSSYIMELIYQDAQIALGSALESKLRKINAASGFSIIDSKSLKFKEHAANFFTLKGKKNNSDVLIFDLYVKTSENTYFNAKSEIYGNDRIQNRLCQFMALLNTVEFLK